MIVDLVTLSLIWSFAALASATPLIFVTLGETLTQRAGVINLGVEGQMLVGACFGFGVAASTDSALLGLLVGALAGAGLSSVHALAVLGARANQIASGIAVWMIGLGVSSYAGRAFVGGNVTPLPRPDVATLREVPVLGSAIAQLGPTALVAVGFVGAVTWWLMRTRPGLALRAVGESATIASENGLSPALIRLQAILAGGLLSGLGGAVLSIEYTQTWAQEITKGQGLIAVGLVIVARWKPALVLPVCLVFGVAETAAVRLPASGVQMSSYVLSALPYLTVMAVLIVTHALTSMRAAMPKDLRAVFE